MTDCGTHARRVAVAGGADLRVSKTSHAPNTLLPAHSHPHATLTCVLGGGYHENFGQGMSELPSLSVVVKPAETIHENRVDARGARCLLLEVSVSSLAEGDLKLFAKPISFILGVSAVNVLRALAYLAERQSADSSLEIESVATELLGWIDGEQSPPSRCVSSRIRRVRERLDDCPSVVPTLAELAREANCHPIYLARAFRRAYGASVGEYARRARIARAARGIATARASSLSGIAQQCGYYDHSHLSHEFRARTGLSPSDWREATTG